MSNNIEIEFDCTNYTILVVDDNPTNLGVITDYLEDVGFDVMVASDGELGLQRARQAEPSIILLDVMMPGMNGFELCRRLKEDDLTKEIPVIFMTARSEPEDKVAGFTAGAVDYVTKPIQQEEVLMRVNTHLRICDLAQQLRQANKELTKLNTDKDKFFSIVAHDLRGPFQPLLGMAKLLSNDWDISSPEDVKIMSGSIYRSARNVFNLLENLLSWSRIQMKRVECYQDIFDLRKVAKKNVKLLTENAAIKEVMLSSQIDDEILVYADEDMVDTIIRNLTSNALKFTPNGGQVIISAQQIASSQVVEIAVSDTGVGMSQENLDRLFKIDAQHTTLGTEQEKGTGLGLIICQEMAEMNGGKLWIETKLGEGTTVKFTVTSATPELN